MMHFNGDSLKELARLCRIDCSKAELEQLMKNLEDILDYVDQLNNINTDSIEPCIQIFDSFSLELGDDDEERSLEIQDFMKNVPEKVGGMIKVPSILKP